MYVGGITYSISKSFGNLQLVPYAEGLRLFYIPIIDNIPDANATGKLDIMLPIDAVGGLWATAKAFLYAVESLDENVILQGNPDKDQSDILIKLYRDKPHGQNGRLAGDEACWLRIVTGRTEEERRRIKLGPRDLLCIELACNSVLVLAGAKGTHQPKLIQM
jgi:hypothetical protein